MLADDLAGRYQAVRDYTEVLCAPLSPEDQTLQSMPDASPAKWHRGHTTWFFETFLLERFASSYERFHPGFAYLFNSYYEAMGRRQSRAERGMVSRPGVAEVSAYRASIDGRMAELLEGRMLAPNAGKDVAWLAELGINHEQQHQELLLMDIKHALSRNPLQPAYAGGGAASNRGQQSPGELCWAHYDGGVVEIGHGGVGFSFDNEAPRHETLLAPFSIASRPATCGEWAEFIDDGGYRRPELWLSEGWATVQAQGWSSPLYWSADGAEWAVFSLRGPLPLDQAEPVCHVSYYEADAFARWRGVRLPTEAEWEDAVTAGWMTGGAGTSGTAAASPTVDPAALHPGPISVLQDVSSAAVGAIGRVWEWTASPYTAYPRFRPAPGAVGEYNGKFMVNQQVLRGGCCASPPGHVRPTYRNFFPAAARWAFSGVRLARDI
ncbi:MAG: ergothioneine biosynthesis protein EgtB [Acidimicrobiales bacterium]